MNKLDIFIAVLLLWGAYRGYKNGFLMSLISLLAVVVGIFAGFKLMGEGMLFLQREFNADKTVLPYLSFLVIFVIIVVLVNLLGKAVKSSIDQTFLGRLDALLGAALGMFRWLFLMSIMIWIMDSLEYEPGSEWTEESVLYPFAEKFATTLAGWISGFLPFIKEIFQQF